MFKRIVITTFLFFLVLTLKSQETVNFITVDQKTYSFWLQKDWDKLIEEGKKGLDKRIDFYYLRMRMGIAYYEKKNYHVAAKHFEKTYEMSAADPYLKEYLYYSYLFSRRLSDAKKIASSFPRELKEKTSAGEKQFFGRVDLTYNYNFIADERVTEIFSINIDPLIDGKQFISKGHSYFNLSLMHDFGPGFSIYHGYSYLDKTDFIFMQEAGVSETLPDYETKLHQYYFSGNARLAKGLNMIFGLHYINIRTQEEKTVLNTGRNYTYLETVSVNDYLVFLSVYKNFCFVTLGGSGYYAELNSNKQLQGDFLLTLYPLGNLNLYTVSTISYQSEEYLDRHKENRLVFDQQLGFKVFNNLWIEGYACFGDMHNFIKSDGFVVFNSMDIIKKRYGGRLIIPFKSGLELKIDYANYNNESMFIPAIPGTTVDKNLINYTNHSITGGIKWNF